MPDTHRYLRFVLHHDGDEDFHYIDLARRLSEINRRSYQQGRRYRIANINVHDSQGDAYVKFCTIPNTWTTVQAWKKGFEAWKRQRREVQKLIPNLSGKWSDFKVYINDDMRLDQDWPPLTDVENNSGSSGEWVYSKFYSDMNDNETVDEFSIHMLGDDNGSENSRISVGLIKAFQQVLSQPQEEPLVPGGAKTGLYAELFAQDSQVAEELVDDMEDENDLPPYPFNIPGGAANMPEPQEIRSIHLSTGANATGIVGGFEVPLGLLVIETKSGTEDNEIGITIEMVPGDYKGVDAPHILETGVE